MARNPAAEWTGESGSLLMSRWDIFCVHTIVGYAPAKAAHFSTRGDGHLFQSRDTKYQSVANYKGNPRVIACENADFGPEFGAWDTDNGHEVPAFSPEQCETLAHLIVWVNRTHGIPIELAPDSKPGSRGIAYHRQGIPGNWAGYAYGGLVSGGEVWTLAPGKVCPGDRRIYQLINVVIPHARALAGLQGDTDMVDWNTKYTFGRTGLTTEYGNWIGETNDAAGRAAGATARIEVKLDAMSDALSDHEAEVLAAIRSINSGAFTDDQVAALAAAINAGTPDGVTPELLAEAHRAAADRLDPR